MFQVEVISVHSHNVASVTARYPVGVVVAERRVGPPAPGAPRPVFIPGCPLPQILSQDTASAELVREKEKPPCTSSKANVHKPLRHTVRPKSAEVDMTVRSTNEDKENHPLDKEYDPGVYVDLLQSCSSQMQFGQRSQRTRDTKGAVESVDNSNSKMQFENMSPRPRNEFLSSTKRTVDSEQSSDTPLQLGECSSKDTERTITRESSHTGPARYVLLHRGLLEISDSSGSGGEDLRRNMTEMSVGQVSEKSTCEKHYGKSDYFSNVESEHGSDIDDGRLASNQEVGCVTSSSDTSNIETVGCATRVKVTREENKRDALIEEMKDPQASRVVQMKRGCLSVRSLPHGTRKPGSDRSRSVRGASVVSSVARETAKCAKLPLKGPSIHHQQSSGKNLKFLL